MSRTVWTCCACGKRTVWGPGWRWVFVGMRLVWCSQACEDAPVNPTARTTNQGHPR